MQNITSWENVKVLLRLEEAAQILAMSPEYLKKLAQKGSFPAVKISPREWRVSKEALRDWITRKPAA